MRQLIIFLIILFFLISCRNDVPEKYGVYVYHNDSVTELTPDKTFTRSNLRQSICGIKNPEYIFKTVDSLIIYFEDIDTSLVRLTQLRYFDGEFVEGITNTTKWANIDLWVADKDITVDKIHLNQKKIGMMVIKPKSRLSAGLYALHFGSMWDCAIRSDSLLNYVYGFRICSQIP
jgi:hypothetical protein